MTKHMFSTEYGKSFASAFDVGCNIQKASPSQSNKKVKDDMILNCPDCVLPVVGACYMYLHQVP